MTELTEATEAILRFYRDIEASAQDWNGEESVRPL